VDDAASADLVSGLRARDPRALKLAYELHKSDVLAVAAAVLGRAAAETAWDVLHDVFIALASAAPGLRADTNLRSYLCRAAMNRARDRLARRPETDDGLAAVPAVATDVSQLIEQGEQAAELWQHVVALPAEQRVVVSLRIWGGLSFPEIARAEGISENTAQSRYRYALEKLRRHYQQEVEQ
jgi:RNA polymerase sigma-70 factor (ECF subfamily)